MCHGSFWFRPLICASLLSAVTLVNGVAQIVYLTQGGFPFPHGGQYGHPGMGGMGGVMKGEPPSPGGGYGGYGHGPSPHMYQVCNFTAVVIFFY